MAVYHVLKDGTRPVDIIGHIVRLDDHAQMCRIAESIIQRINTYEEEKHSKEC